MAHVADRSGTNLRDLAELVHVRVSKPSRNWPAAWITPSKPDMYCIARLHLGWDRDLLMRSGLPFITLGRQYTRLL